MFCFKKRTITDKIGLDMWDRQKMQPYEKM